ncbi:AsmA family protein [Pinibacter aurantiacus]|uniref:DUF748 domain-containing protein n=1 Tax=Pinibacter aurantiacus TaxID=2851599 RepID=A0A9E2SDW9_9BACT|nr:hypothetical protein [Pinibacter aurantiacus]MBV4359653.1 hypothetical protein [Pinibacter aurantiacus]
MNLSSRQKKWTIILLIPFALLFILGGILHYLIAFKIKDIAKYAVYKESDGVYSFDASSIDVSIWKKTIVLRNCQLVCNDTTNVVTSYSAGIPEVYFRLQSVGKLLFNKQVAIDSMAVVMPHIDIRSHKTDTKEDRPISFHASQIIDVLHKMVASLQVRSFNIKDASLSYISSKTGVPFQSDHINFYVSNFSKKDKEKKYLFSSDDIDMYITDQHWKLPDGIHEVAFKKLHFSGKNQYFELDSCLLKTKATPDHAGIEIATDKLFFNSKNLQNVYQNNALEIDTLNCIHPVLSMETSQKKGHDTTRAVSNALQRLFERVNFKYLSIVDGQVLQNGIGNTNPTYGTRKANIQVYNLDYKASRKEPLTTDSVKLRLSEIAFISPDSMRRLEINDFYFNKNELLMYNAIYAPTEKNNSSKGLKFKTPALRIENISLADLLNEKLKGTKAQLYAPHFTMFDKTPATKANPGRPNSMDNFYKVLHGLHEMIDVDTFQVIEGELRYDITRNSTHSTLKNLNATILLQKLFDSDSLVDIKRSLPELTVGEINLSSPKIKLNAKQYRFKGTHRHNWAKSFNLRLKNNTSIKGHGLYWEIFDWDLLANRHIISFEYLKANKLMVDNESTTTAAGKNATAKKLPVITIRRLDVDTLLVEKKIKNGGDLKLTGRNICLDDIASKDNYLVWGNMAADFNNIHLANPNMNVQIDKFSINSEYQNEMNGVSFKTSKEGRSTSVAIPQLIIKTQIHSSRIKEADINEIVVNNAKAIIHTRSADFDNEVKKDFKMPFNLDATKLVVNNASLKYTAEKITDTTTADLKLDMNVKDLKTSKEGDAKLSYGLAIVTVKDAQIRKGLLDVQLPLAALISTNGRGKLNSENKLQVNSGLEVKWENVSVKTQKGDSVSLAINKLTGSYTDSHFSSHPAEKQSIQTILNRATVSNGNMVYKGKKSTVNVGSISWNESTDKLTVRDFSMLPNISRDSAFKEGNWQADYLTVSGKELSVEGIHLKRTKGDSSIAIRNITFDSLLLATARDKRLPFKHGVEKPMPTMLIRNIPLRVDVDTIRLKNSHVEVHEISKVTNQEGVIPINNINAIITNFSNYNNSNDSLTIYASADIFGGTIRRFHYKEAYGDSLSAFSVMVTLSPLRLPGLTTAVMPLSGVKVNDGKSDTLFASWVGNKYAAVGDMNFYYDKLKIELLDPKDFSHHGLKIRIENMLASALIKKSNNKNSKTFFVRDREKFVFNYWVKTCLSGLLTSVGMKKNKKYLKEYNSNKEKYSLPAAYRVTE